MQASDNQETLSEIRNDLYSIIKTQQAEISIKNPILSSEGPDQKLYKKEIKAEEFQSDDSEQKVRLVIPEDGVLPENKRLDKNISENQHKNQEDEERLSLNYYQCLQEIQQEIVEKNVDFFEDEQDHSPFLHFPIIILHFILIGKPYLSINLEDSNYRKSIRSKN